MELVILFGYLCTAGSVCFQLVGVQVIAGVVRKGGTGDMSPFTFITYFVACATWLKYGLMQELPVVIGVNLFGAVLNFIYTLFFYRYTIKKVQFYRCTITGAVLLLSPLLYIKYYQTDLQLASDHLGKYCVLMSIIGYGAPLVSLSDVVRTKNTECLSFPLIFANLIIAILWTTYGRLIADVYVTAPNLLGAGLSLIQLSLFVIYPAGSQKGKIIHS